MNFYYEVAPFLALIVALTLHECAHAWSASLLGDDFARRQGRVSLWPGRHLSLVGTLVFFVLHFGWGKPVPVNLYNFKRPKRDYLLTSLAGPGANVLTIGVCFALMFLTRRTYHFGPDGETYMIAAHTTLAWLALISAILAAINLLPVPPLDGSKIWQCIIPGLKPTLKPKTTWLFVGLLLFMLYTNKLDPIFKATQQAVLGILPVSVYELHQMGQAAANEAAELAEAGQDGRATEAWTWTDELCSQALAIDPQHHELYYLRCGVRLRLGRTEEALADIERAIEIAPDRPIYYQWRADVLDILGRPDEAKRAREEARALGGEGKDDPLGEILKTVK